jgi:polyhydroxyalkanoate synthesis regulator phasin
MWKRHEFTPRGKKGTFPGKSTGRGAAVLTGLIIVLLLLVIGFSFTSIPGKIKRGLREVIAPPAVGRSQQEIADLLRAEGDRIRAEKDAEAHREIEALRRQLEAASGQTLPEVPEPPKPDFIEAGPEVEVRRSGIPFKLELNLEQGSLASHERTTPDSYTAAYTLNIRLPSPAKTLEDLQKSNPKLGTILPGLPEILKTGEVSKWYQTLYDNKTTRLKRDAAALTNLLNKHNLFDCETILNLKAPGGRRAMLLQADMDVVSDGSDGDRLATMPDEIVNSTHYQPFTSYGWPKKTKTPNPMVAGWERRLAEAEKEAAARDTPAKQKQVLKNRIETLKRGIADLKARSFLIAEYDPFIVIPVTMLAAKDDPFTPNVGDYALVIYGEKILPAIVGDGGPTFKVGEASLRMARELNVRASPYSRPVSDLKVTYLVFPGSREERRGPPDYNAWRAKCESLVGEFGGLGEGYEIGTWTDLLAPPPVTPPAPVPQVAPPSTQSPAPNAPIGGSPKPGPAIPPHAPTVPPPAGNPTPASNSTPIVPSEP